jgi:uncharacterized protein YdhG (YjbR/CyaY superfamily)
MRPSERVGTKTGKQLVDAYIAASAPKARPMLRALRRVIRSCAPKATERLSYGMPYYAHFGRLVYFAAFKNHISLFVWGRPMRVYAKRVEKYKAGKATLQFPIGTKVPVALVKQLISMRVRDNEAAAAAKS